MIECKHDRVYSNRYLLSHPPQKEWICRICGAEGVEAVQFAPYTFANEYDAIKKKFQDKV